MCEKKRKALCVILAFLSTGMCHAMEDKKAKEWTPPTQEEVDTIVRKCQCRPNQLGYYRPNTRGMRPVDARLWLAAGCGDYNGAERALREGADPNAQNVAAEFDKKNTALHQAVEHGDARIPFIPKGLMIEDENGPRQLRWDDLIVRVAESDAESLYDIVRAIPDAQKKRMLDAGRFLLKQVERDPALFGRYRIDGTFLADDAR